MKITARPECAADYVVVSDLVSAAFGSEEAAAFVAALRRNEEHFDPALSLVAEVDDGIVVGYLLLFPLPDSERRILALYPLAITPEYQQRGIGKTLVREALRVAEIRGYGGAVVMGPSGYYARFGFRPAEEWGIFPDLEIVEGDFLAIEFQLCGLSPGFVKYPGEFRLRNTQEAENSQKAL